MGIYRLENASTSVPEIVVVHKEKMRAFKAADVSHYPIAFRSDTRGLKDIEKTGFQRKKTVLDKYSDRVGAIQRALKAKSMNEEEITDYLSSMVAIRMSNVDIDTDCGVCFTREFRIAGLFPYEPKKPEVLNTKANVYVVRLRGWLETYRMQKFLAPHLEYSKEVASLGVPFEDVLGCVTVKRELNNDTVHLTIEGSQAAADDRKDAFEAVVRTLKDTTVATPPQKDGLFREHEADEKFRHIEAALNGLTGVIGTRDFPKDGNVIKDGKLIELDYYAPPKDKAKQPQVSPY